MDKPPKEFLWYQFFVKQDCIENIFFQDQISDRKQSWYFPYWSHQPNRRVGAIASSANSLLSRLEPSEVLDYSLPSRIPGRGVLLARFGEGEHALLVAIAHLSLSIKARLGQIAFLSELLGSTRHAVLMGDFNCEPEAPEMRALYERAEFARPGYRLTR